MRSDNAGTLAPQCFGRSSKAVTFASPQLTGLDVALEFLLFADQFARAVN